MYASNLPILSPRAYMTHVREVCLRLESMMPTRCFPLEGYCKMYGKGPQQCTRGQQTMQHGCVGMQTLPFRLSISYQVRRNVTTDKDLDIWHWLDQGWTRVCCLL
jgi:hypothetical protein